MNTNGIQKVAKEKTATVVGEAEVTYSRFKIVDSEEDKRLRISWRDTEGKKREKEFSYKVKSKADQMKAAEAFRAGLIKQYFN